MAEPVIAEPTRDHFMLILTATDKDISNMSINNDIITALGPLAKLIGTWTGNNGWNIIAVPDRAQKVEQFKLHVQNINETIVIKPGGANVPNAGLDQNQFVSALEYEWRVSDAQTNEPLHFENGMWLVLQGDNTSQGRTARMISVPHGNSVLMTGDYLDLDNQQPKIDLELTSLPTGAGPQTRDNTYLNQYFEAQEKLKGEFDVLNPNTFLQQRLEGIEIKKMLVLNVNSTNKGGGIVNTQFISSHADVPAMDCTFWLEEGVDKNGKKVEFLQYTQNITLDFFDVKWPHIDVNTLIRQS